MSGRQIYLNFWRKFSLLLNPALCQDCGIHIAFDSFFCTSCLDALEKVKSPCLLCGQPNHAVGEVCAICLHKPPRWNALIAPLSYRGSTRQLIHQLKFGDRVYLARALVHHHAQYFKQRPVEILLPVPLHRSRLLERGFNQSLEIALALSAMLNISVDTDSLSRIRPTEAQSGLSLNQRQKNILQAFDYSPQLPYRSIALVDDIVTTGSTVSEICKTLRRAGAEHIEIWSLARALKA